MSYVNYDYVVEQLREAGLEIELPIELARNEKSVRCRIAGGDHEKRGWYRLYEHLIDNELYLVGSYGVFHGDDPGTRKVELTRRCEKCGASVPLRDKQCPSCGSKKIRKAELSEEQKAALAARLAADKKRAAAERQAEIEQASQWASSVWRACKLVERVDEHDYLPRKHLDSAGGARIFTGNDGIDLVGAEKDDFTYLASFTGSLAVPIMDAAGKIFGLQFILSRALHSDRIRRIERDKDVWPRGLSMEAHYFLIGPSPTSVLLIAEGYATGLSLHQATGQTVAVAYNAGNIGPVVAALKKHYRKARRLICADDDWLQKCVECKAYTPVKESTCAHCGKPHKKLNAGIQRADEASLAHDCAWVAPVFSADRPVDRKGPTDFNDLACLEGDAAVRAQIEAKLLSLKIAPTPAALPENSARGNSNTEGGGDSDIRPDALAIMPVDDLVDRFIPIDDGTGKIVFDRWTNKLAMKEQMISLLPAGARGDDIKRHPLWAERGAYYLDQIGFDPSGKDKEVRLNTWQGWPSTPRDGDCGLLLELIYHQCSKETTIASALYKWLLQWMAWPLQNPGGKMGSAVVMHGPQGTGKSKIFTTLARLYGYGRRRRNYAIVIDGQALHANFNLDWENKLYINAEEVVNASDKWELKNQLKHLVTGDTIRVEGKHINAVHNTNRVNVSFLSNDLLPFPIEPDDRRHFVIYTPPPLPKPFFKTLVDQLDTGGLEAFHYHLLYHVDCADFDHTAPPMTEAKRMLMRLSSSSELRFLADWAAGEIGLPVVPALAADVYDAYSRWCRNNGEPRPRPANYFHAAVHHLGGGWEKKKSRIYASATSAESDAKPIIFPPPESMQRAGTAMPEGASVMRWATDSVAAFRQAVHGTTEERNQWAS